jgi:hypothetical protein
MKYYRVLDLQLSRYFSTGYNETSLDELIKDFQSYIIYGSDSLEIDTNNQDEINEYFGTWDLIADYLQGVELEESDEPFEKLDDDF